jgi:hypothetical protein
MSLNRNPPSHDLAARQPPSDPAARQQAVDDLKDFFVQLQEDINPPHPPPADQNQAPDRTAGQRAEDNLGDLFTQLHGGSVFNMIEVFTAFFRKALHRTYQAEHVMLWNELIQSILSGNEFSEDQQKVIAKMII